MATKYMSKDTIMFQPRSRQIGPLILSPAEELLRGLFLACREDIQKPRLEIWITGGWVRDRLLGTHSSDIDIALSDMTGEHFSHCLTDFLRKNEALYRKRAAELNIPYHFSGFHTTKKNLGKSKRLETAVGSIFGLDIDLVNLRKEVYEGGSRTPDMEFGTAEEDAFRRDATVNALFFNLDTRQIVDLTGKGLQDMTSCVIRTPLEPQRTFIDDPLRVLRLIRIGSKLGYKINARTKESMRDPRIHEALEAKVSRERIGIEVFKIMKQAKPHVAFHMIWETNLYTSVFLMPRFNPTLLSKLKDRLPAQNESQPWPNTWQLAYRTLDVLINHHASSLSRIIRSESAEDMWLMVAYSPIAGLREQALEEVIAVAAEAVKTRNQASKLLGSSLRNLDSIRNIVHLTSNLENPPPRSAVGMAIRSWGSTWRSQVLYSFLAELVYNAASTPLMPLEGDVVFDGLLTKYDRFADFILRSSLENADSFRPLLNGHAIMELFGLRSGGAFIKGAIDGLLAWQLDHNEMNSDDAAVWLRSRKDEFGIPLAEPCASVSRRKRRRPACPDTLVPHSD
ncbi:putative poly(A) polymerase [Xylaria intraflava]|nr:putative poly(A) polymerase [Xylaria intraflava]